MYKTNITQFSTYSTVQNYQIQRRKKLFLLINFFLFLKKRNILLTCLNHKLQKITETNLVLTVLKSISGHFDHVP